MEEQLKAGGKASLADLNRRIVADVEEFGAYLRPKDDITFILARCSDRSRRRGRDSSDEADREQPDVDVRHVRDSSPSSSAE